MNEFRKHSEGLEKGKGSQIVIKDVWLFTVHPFFLQPS